METKDEVIREFQKIPWFQELDPVHLQKISEISRLRHVRAGEVLFREGDAEDYLYIVVEGRVALDMFIPHQGKVRIYTAEPWDVFGWSSVIPIVRKRTAGAVAVIEGSVIAIHSEKLRQVCDEDHDLGYVVMRRLANIVASRLLVTRLQMLDMFASLEVKNGK